MVLINWKIEKAGKEKKSNRKQKKENDCVVFGLGKMSPFFLVVLPQIETCDSKESGVAIPENIFKRGYSPWHKKLDEFRENPDRHSVQQRNYDSEMEAFLQFVG